MNVQDFYPRPPRGERPLRCGGHASPGNDFYPRPPRGGRQKGGIEVALVSLISIHALREEGDVYRFA